MTTIIYIIVFGIIAFAIIRIIINSMSGCVYSPNDEESKTQINSAKRNLKEIWDIEPGKFWIPLDGTVSQNMCYFNIDEFDINFGLKKLSGLINQIEKGKIYSFAESNIFSQIDSLNLEKYSGLDTYYSNSSADWVIYITHENTIAFGGSSIIDALKTQWMEGEKFINPWEKNDTDNTK